MKIPELKNIEANSKDVIAKININDLIKVGLSLNDDFEIPEEFFKAYELKNDDLYFLDVSRSNGWHGNIEIHFTYVLGNTGDENVHCYQEIKIIRDRSQLLFVCPFLGEGIYCKELVLRNDFPLFGSSEGLSIGLGQKGSRVIN